MTNPSDVVEVPLLIVGGGIGGLATALGCARAGRPAHLIEQASASSKSVPACRSARTPRA